ncbi:hypothetical protein M9H77_18888 [Catharanthus roseus]|uniref:Uncharacterized protein n=1 Tax=Catharanthus roseus TaxID=4058 RepID=A0ACC0B8P0_CATRO|nr:hypothetical protein M9H77_18888 [Catharanthus roseus]
MKIGCFFKEHDVALFALLETKLDDGRIFDVMRWKFNKWKVMHNFDEHEVQCTGVHDQVIHSHVTCLVSSKSFYVSFDSLYTFGMDGLQPWIVLGDFNSILEGEDWISCAQPTAYEAKDFLNCCVDLGLTDIQYTGARQKFSHIVERARVAREELKKQQILLHDNPTDSPLLKSVKKLQFQAANLIEAERKFCIQKTKVDFLLNGDKGTKLFHSLIKRNLKRNFIASLTKKDGTPTASKNEVHQEFLQFYMSFHGSEDAAVQLLESWCKEGRFDASMAYNFFKPSTQLAVLERFPTKDKLEFLGAESTSYFCKQHEETMQHIFFSCRFSIEVWNAVKMWTGLRRSMTTIKAA